MKLLKQLSKDKVAVFLTTQKLIVPTITELLLELMQHQNCS